MLYFEPKAFGWRLGNQMFNVATLHALAKRHNDSAIYPEWNYARFFTGPFPTGDYRPMYSWNQPGFHYEEIPYRRSLAIGGYFQSEKFFKDYEQDIRDMFQFSDEALAIAKDNMLELNRLKYPTCSIHVRRTDYLTHPQHHPVLSAEWYAKAMAHMGEDTTFVVFGDDIEWAKQNLQAKKIVFLHSHEIADFIGQTYCDNHIVANSSFSWWAAWLNSNPEKVVISPNKKAWFGPALAFYNMDDLIPDGWIQL